MKQKNLFDFSPEPAKLCKRCNEVKPLTEFYAHPGGRCSSYCKSCTKAYGKEWQPTEKVDQLELFELKAEKWCKDCGEMKPISEFRLCGGGRWRDTYCIPCSIERGKNNAKENPDQVNARNRRWRSNNKERVSEQAKARYYADHEKTKWQKRQWHFKNRDKMREYYKTHRLDNLNRFKETQKRYKQSEKGRAASTAYANKRRTSKENSMPLWADEIAIKEIYNEAAGLREQGIDVQVDHIIPLHHKKVCGLHCEDNLQIIGSTENREKGNKFEG